MARCRLPVDARSVRETMVLRDRPCLVLAGAGARRWGVVRRNGAAVALVADRVQQRLSLHVDGLAADGRRRRTLEFLRAIDGAVADGLGIAGWIGCEAGLHLEGLPAHPGRYGLPDGEWITFDPQDLRPVDLPDPAPAAQVGPPPASLADQQEQYEAAVASAREAIAAGAIYQANLTVVAAGANPIDIAELDPLAAAAAILAVQPVPYASVWLSDGHALLSGAMERFVRCDGSVVRSRPIKGTAPRGANPDCDAAARAALLASEKERAENTMIVDMVRNDLQRACSFGSVRVAELLATEPYATLWHLESEIEGRLRPGAGWADLLAATLPPASVTGCPKIEACKVIARLENRWRGPYCGAFGYALPGDRGEFAVGIRQVLFAGGVAEIAVGAGIVADSQPEAEWRETLLKARSGLALLARLRNP
jgi:anthranilate/para-aminobenzoate synthase component I